MSIVLLILLALALFGSVAFMVYKRHKKPKRIMREGKLLKSEMVSINGEQLYVESNRQSTRSSRRIAVSWSTSPKGSLSVDISKFEVSDLI